jgi:hypothetical protein
LAGIGAAVAAIAAGAVVLFTQPPPDATGPKGGPAVKLEAPPVVDEPVASVAAVPNGALAPDGMASKPSSAGPAPAKPAAVMPATGQPLEFLVHFKDSHPMARAQNLAGENRMAEAEALAKRILVSRSDLAGLCLKGFTLGGAEVVLRPCEELPPRRHDSAARQWLKLLRAQGSVDYADRNVVLQPGSDAAVRPPGAPIAPPKP